MHIWRKFKTNIWRRSLDLEWDCFGKSLGCRLCIEFLKILDGDHVKCIVILLITCTQGAMLFCDVQRSLQNQVMVISVNCSDTGFVFDGIRRESRVQYPGAIKCLSIAHRFFNFLHLTKKKKLAE